jgi:uncharacterized damage-inducible protein DinB
MATERRLITSIENEYRRYKALGESAIGQLSDDQLSARAGDVDNSIAVIVWHVSGNLTSRFTDFLTSDGEKPWRHREEEFSRRTVTRDELLAKWNDGWRALLDALQGLADDDLFRTVAIRGQSLAVHEALHRSLAHTAHHVGQIVYLAKALRGSGWSYLSIPPGRSEQYNAAPALDRPADQAKALDHARKAGA